MEEFTVYQNKIKQLIFILQILFITGLGIMAIMGSFTNNKIKVSLLIFGIIVTLAFGSIVIIYIKQFITTAKIVTLKKEGFYAYTYLPIKNDIILWNNVKEIKDFNITRGRYISQNYIQIWLKKPILKVNKKSKSGYGPILINLKTAKNINSKKLAERMNLFLR